MIGHTLTELRSRIEALSTADGTYAVTCGRTNARVVPVNDRRFPDRETAAEAINFAEQYRAALRRYDPHVPCTDPIVLETTASDPQPTAGTPTTRVEHCHRIADVVFETLSERDHDDVQNAVLDAYLDAAETTARPQICRHLVERLSTELHARLTPSTRTAVLGDAADKLPAAPSTPAAVLDHLHATGHFDTYTHAEDAREPTTHHVTLTDYALVPTDRALPTLPLHLELYDAGGPTATATAATRTGPDTWRLALTTDPDHGRAVTPIQNERVQDRPSDRR